MIQYTSSCASPTRATKTLQLRCVSLYAMASCKRSVYERYEGTSEANRLSALYCCYFCCGRLCS